MLDDTKPQATPPPGRTRPMPPVSAAPQQPPLIPPPPASGPLPPGTPPRSTRGRRPQARRRSGWWGTLLGVLAVTLIVLLAGLVLLLLLAPEYVDPFVNPLLPGRQATSQASTANAVALAATSTALADRVGALPLTETAASVNIAATVTSDAVNAVATQAALANQLTATQVSFTRGLAVTATADALAASATVIALDQIATANALIFDATRTAIAMAAESTSLANAQAARDAQQTAVAAATIQAIQPIPLATRVGDGPQAALFTTPTMTPTPLGVLFSDDFSGSTFASAWQREGDWLVVNGAASAGTCGSTLSVGDSTWQSFAVDVSAASAGALFSVRLGYGPGNASLYTTFDRGTISWLLDGPGVLENNTEVRNAFDATRLNRYRLEARGTALRVLVNGRLVAERAYAQPLRGPVALFTCPNASARPLFDSVSITQLAPS